MPKAKKPAPVTPDLMNSAAIEQVRSYVRRAQRLDEEMDELKDDLSELFKEAKGAGYDVKVLRKVIARLKRDPAKLAEEEAILDLYLTAVQGDLFADASVKVTISVPGGAEVSTDLATMQKIADDPKAFDNAVKAKAASKAKVDA